MSRMNQVMQIGNIEGDVHYYIEDYAYTYLKKQKGKEKLKYFLYGEKEEKSKQKKLYIYGIAEKPKMEQTYFKEYYPLGFLKMNQDEMFWIDLKGQQKKIPGYYIFYAPNQAMQEYLVDHQTEDKQDKPEHKSKRQMDREMLPMKETLIPARKIKQISKKEFKNEKFIFPIGGIVVACLILVILTSANGQRKIEIFRQVIAATLSDRVKGSLDDEFIIEEKNIGQENVRAEEMLVQTEIQEDIIKHENTVENEDTTNQETEKQSEETGKIISDENRKEETENVLKEELEETGKDSASEYEEYVVKIGDTLAAICKAKYGSLEKMKEICNLNDIKNADYIAPGQKLYLP